MPQKLRAAIIGAVIALIVGVAASYGLISQDTAEQIKATTGEILSEEPASTQQPAPGGTTQPAQTPAPQ